MQAAIQLTPIKDRAAVIEQFDQDLKAGKLDIPELYRKAARDREHASLTNSIPQGLGLAGVTGISLIVIAGSPIGLVMLVAGGLVSSRVYLGLRRWQDFQDACTDNDFAEFLTDRELSEIEDLIASSGKPATPVLAESYAQLIDSMDDVVELEDSPLRKLAKQFRGEDTNASDAVVDTTAEPVRESAGDTATSADGVEISIYDDTQNTSDPQFIGNPFLKPADTLPKLDPTELIYPPIVLIWGGQGSGKTTLANKVIYTAVAASYLVCVADPHYGKGDWPGLPVYGKGGDYEECDLVMLAVLVESKKRYQQRVDQGTKPQDFQQLLVVLEEFTDWSDECSNSAEFIKKACKDFRKVGIHVLVVAHNNTIAATGGAKGNSQSFAKNSLQVESFSEMKDVSVGSQLTQMLRPTGECYVVAQGREVGKHTMPNLANWEPPIDANVQPFIIDLESLPSSRNNGNFTSEEAKYPDVFSKTINRIESGVVDLESVCELSSSAIIRVIKFVANGHRDEEITPRNITNNVANRDAGVSTVSDAREALDVLVYLKLAHSQSEGKSYLIAQ
ncbi:hypothetical protein D0962_15360 [Leptolyngbyaceae cyanobacterium CCMR0082]|uniref:Uncharacterized protein n=1 Tax=Adonisia turfae CCMR0082 TaxID=2304604 RepID=A0A6M0S870_9CYAN|nr:ATP-binding protein [Adonisia turfae]NEZ64151.1 hypothetical protein [Adonisia turfae CCMR0082]